MKKSIFFIFLSVFCLAIFNACASSNSATVDSELTPNIQTKEESTTITCKIVYGGGTNNLVLAGTSGIYGDVFVLPVAEIPVEWQYQDDDASVLTDGMLIEVEFDGEIMETFPARFSNVTRITVLNDFDNLCKIYLDVLNDLWDVDSGLNSDISELGIDLSKTRLSQSEQSAVAYAFAQQHGLMPLEGTMDELIEQGYITGLKLEDSDITVYQWYDGCLFSITESELESEGTVTFDAEKWCSGTGAYYYTDCTTTRDENGMWSAYELGGEAIS